MIERFYPGTDHQEVCMKKIREIMSSPKPSGNYWAKEIAARQEQGIAQTPLAIDLAKRALGL